MKNNILFFLTVLIISICSASWAEDSLTPWNFVRSDADIATVKEKRSTGGYESLLASAVGKIWKSISAVDGDRCPMYPTCSAYSAEAFRKHGLVIGAVMTADRLIHEADESGIAPRVDVGGRIRSFDPVSRNDFWWYGKGK